MTRSFRADKTQGRSFNGASFHAQPNAESIASRHLQTISPGNRCGKIIGKQYSRPTSDGHKERDNPAGFGILGFLFPLVGLILYLVWKDDYPKKAYAAGSGALWGFILAVAAGVTAGIVVYIQTTNMLNSLF